MAKIIQMKDSEGLIYPISNVYSTEEKEIGIWIDGKPLYRRTIFSDTSTGTINVDYESIMFKNVNVMCDNKFLFPDGRYTSPDDRVDFL